MREQMRKKIEKFEPVMGRNTTQVNDGECFCRRPEKGIRNGHERPYCKADRCGENKRSSGVRFTLDFTTDVEFIMQSV